MSEIKTEKLSPRTGSGTVTLGTSGDTFSIPSGVTLSNSGTATGFGGDNSPAFEAFLSSDQTCGDATYTKLQANTEVFDTDTAYDNSTNYRFTVPSGEGGKYRAYAQIVFYSAANTNDVKTLQLALRKNGTTVAIAEGNRNGYGISATENVECTLILSAGDYLEAWGYMDNNNGAQHPRFAGEATWPRSFFGAYKLIGI
tara:strand:- start:4506 stop:5102 length:597 start_codon:yes stop_codon:yes gene_type:complete